MNYKNFRSIAFIAALIVVFACAKKEEAQDSVASDSKEWKEMDEFHMIMAETFHPFKDSANLEPAKTRASELVAAAEKWSGSTLPDKVNNDEMKGKLEELKNETSAFAQTVTAGDDKVIGDQLTKIHDLFHGIQEAWYGGGEKHEHQH